MIFLESDRKSEITSILKAFMLYAYLEGFIVIYITENINDGNMIKNIFYEEYLDDIIVFDLFTIFDFEDYIQHIDDTRSIIVIRTTYMDMEKLIR